MSETPHRYSDGRTAFLRPALLQLQADRLSILDAEGDPLARWPVSTIRQLPQEGVSNPIFLSTEAPDARLLIADPALAARVVAASRPGRTRATLRGAAWIVGITAAGLLFLIFGIPALAALSAPAWPEPWQAFIGREVEDGLQEKLGKNGKRAPACLDEAASKALTVLTERLASAASLDQRPTVTIIGADLVNAFALPGHRVVVTRGMIQFLRGPEELAGVLGHEFSHLKHYDAMAGIAAGLGWRIAAELALGTGMSSGVAQTLLATRFSRGVESRADAEGLQTLQRAGIDSHAMPLVLARFAELDGQGFLSLLATHPDPKDRAAALTPGPGGAKAMGDAEWAAIKKACG